jgi:glycosyltransferase involved in cell wall biosynthesis
VVARARRDPKGVSGPVDLNRRRFRVLFLLPFPPRLHGRHGGATVTGQLIAGLARRHDIAALYLTGPSDPPAEDELRRLCGVLEGVESSWDPTKLSARLTAKLALLRGRPTWASELSEPRFGARAAELAASWWPDVIQLEYPVMGQYLKALDDCAAPRVLVDHEASVRDLRQFEGPFGRLTETLDERAWRRFEAGLIEHVQAVVVFTDRGRRALEGLAAQTPVVQIPLGTSPPASASDPVGGSPPAVLFVGNFTHPPNADAALWLAAELFPPVRATHPDARLIIVGAAPGPELRALAGEGVVVTGEVPDVAPYLEDAAVVAAPVRTGGGMRVKVLEALAAGKAVVATPLAVEGLNVATGDQLEVAQTADELRRAISRLLSDEEARRALGARARAWAVEHLSWSESIARYEALYDSLTTRAET